MAEIKYHDFVELQYTGSFKDSKEVFDTTDAEIAKKNNIFNEHDEYNPVIVCIGENQLVKGIDSFLVGKETGKNYRIELSPDNTFGKKDASLIQLIPTKKFLQQNINPMPGLQVNIDGIVGTIKNVGGGRTLVDFNHPLSGKDIVYELKVNRIVEEDREKILSFLKNILKTDEKECKIELNEGNASIELNDKLPKEFKEELSKKLKDIISSLKEVNFTNKENK